jgi:hypothetical protein
VNIGSMLDSILDQCVAEDVSVSLAGGKLILTGRQATLDEWRPLLGSMKAELLAMLADSAATLQRREAAFVTRGVDPGTAHALALRLKTRDGQNDERRLCLECSHLTGTADPRRCARWQRAGLGGPQVPRELPAILQRCNVFHQAWTDF